MDEEVVGTQKKKKKNPIKRFFKILFSIIFLALVAVIGLVIYLVVNIASTTNYTGNESVEQIKSENKSLDVVSSYIMYDAINDIDSTKKVELSLDETNMNYLLHAVSQKIDFGSLNVSNIYTYYDSENPGTYSFYMPMKWIFFKSCLYGTVNIEYVEADSSSSDELLSKNHINLNFTNLTLGDLSTSNWLIKNIVLRFMNSSYLENIFTDVGILNTKASIDGSNIKISLPTESITNLVFNNSTGKVLGLAQILYSNLDENGCINYEFDEKIGLECDCSNILLSTTSSSSIESDLASVKTNMNTLISNSVVSQSNSNLVFNYLVNGYDYLNDTDKKTILTYDLSSINLNDTESIEAYDGVINRNSETIDFTPELSDIKDLILGNTNSLGFKIYESYVNSKFKESDVIGTSLAFVNNLNDSFAYILIEDIYVDFTNSNMSINILLDINGVETNIQLNFVQNSEVTGKLLTNLNSVYLGNLAIDEDDYSSIISFIDESVDISFIVFDDELKSLTIDFSEMFSDLLNEVIEEYSLTNITYSLNDGYILLTMSNE